MEAPSPAAVAAVPQDAVHYLEIVADDVDATCRLFETAHGWSFGEPVEALGGARVAEMPGGCRCGVRGSLSEEETPIVRTYLRVPDVEAAARLAEDAGATVILPSMDLPGHGRIAIFVVGGVQQGVWELP